MPPKKSTKQAQEEPDEFKDLPFEDALAMLNETVKTLEAGELPLSEATRLYEKGMKLSKICTDKLSATELRITQIQNAFESTPPPLPEEELMEWEDPA